MRKLKIAGITFLLLFSLTDLMAFCGFYVAKTDASLFNETSQVIIVRDGTRTIVTMSSDFKGEVKDFAMVVPVPEVLKKDQVRTVNHNIFTKSDAYSAARLAEYYDPQLCIPEYEIVEMEEVMDYDFAMEAPAMAMDAEDDYAEYKVTVVEKFSVDEYDIVILSAEESDGLERWLTDNGYKIPEGAQEVLDPYIKSEMKFFVVKVNLEKMGQSPTQTLNPIQISYNSNNFMLPIRLGMANAKSDQDMLVYTFTRKGRVETTNYRTTQIPTGQEVPLFVQGRFGEFYKDLFEKSWKKEGKNTVWLEYAWNLSASNPVKCDPCSAELFTHNELKEAGVFWIQDGGYGQYRGDLFMTRLHVRYKRKTFPQDLAFQITTNTENFQGRYVIRHPAPGPFDCDEAQPYLRKLKSRRRKEVKELASLTGWKTGQFSSYIHEYDSYMNVPKPAGNQPEGHGMNENTLDAIHVNETALANSTPIQPKESLVEPTSSTPDPFLPEQIEKSEDPEYMTAKASTSNRKEWLVVPLILIAIFTVLGISRKRKNIG